MALAVARHTVEHQFHLGNVAVAIADVVGRQILVGLDKLVGQLGGAPGAADAALAVDDDAVAQPAGLGQREEPEIDCRWIAARHGDQACVAQFRAIHFAQPVDEFRQQFRRRVLQPIPALIGCGAGEAEIGAQVDDADAGGGKGARGADGVAVGQAKKDHVDLAGARIGILQRNQRIIPRHRVNVVETFARAVGTRDPAKLHVRVAVDQVNEFDPCVAGCPGDACLDHLLSYDEREHWFCRAHRTTLCRTACILRQPSGQTQANKKAPRLESFAWSVRAITRSSRAQSSRWVSPKRLPLKPGARTMDNLLLW